MSDRSPAPGRVIYGLQLGDFGHLNRPVPATWNSETEARYMDQVRERAQQMAKDILAQALAEAEKMKSQARAEGLAAGRADAVALAQAEAGKVSAFLASLQSAFAAEKSRVYTEQRQALFQILRLAFEKTLGVMLEAERERALQALFEEAVNQLQARTSITVHVCQADAQQTRDLAAKAREASPEMPELRIVVSPDLEPGGVRIESGDGLVDNSIASRFEQVRAILDGYSENP